MPVILSQEQAEERFQISNYDPINAMHHERVLLFEGDTDIPGDLNPDWVSHTLREIGEADDIGELLILINGNLNVSGDIAFSDYRPSLLVLGNVSCDVLKSADECMCITGDATIKYAYYGYYNDGTITIHGITRVPYVLNSDHASQINPEGAILINVYSDHDDFFEYDYTTKDLPAVLVAEVLDKGEWIKVWPFINMLKAGKSPFIPGAKTPRQAFEEKLEKLISESPLAVTELSLSEQKFKVFPSSLTALRNLRKLDISDNILKTIPDSIGDLELLEELHINKCALESISPAIGKLKNLRVLNISGNLELTTLPDTIRQLSNLQTLNLDHTAITFSDAFAGLHNLEEISMYSCFNDAEAPAAFPMVLTQLKKLRKLDIRKNRFQSLPTELTQLKYLEEISWTDSRTESPLPDFSQCTSLKKLNISRSFSPWKNIVFNIPTLEYLRIDRNKEEKEFFDADMLALWEQMAAEDPEQYAHLPEMIKHKQLEPDGRYSLITKTGITMEDLEKLSRLPNLKYLDLSFNGLTALPDSLYALTKLEHLNLANNKLSAEQKEKVTNAFKQTELIF